jgi:hypothetical protein
MLKGQYAQKNIPGGKIMISLLEFLAASDDH